MITMTRRPIYFNSAASSWNGPSMSTAGLELVSGGLDKVSCFHKQLPGYQPTPLISIDAVAQELGVKAVHVKDESNRFGLPSFKILGASWAVLPSGPSRTRPRDK